MAELNMSERVEWPARAVVTAGMPYGNKPLHFGHIGGVFVPADCFARFLRDRIGADNVRFVSGTDCFGSPINEGYRKAVEAGQCNGGIADYVMANHQAQKSTLEDYQISLDIYEGSGIGHAGDVHQMVTDGFIRTLHRNGFLRLSSTLQFYDTQAGTFLNGRQVHGRCPVAGCKSENAYADECDLGHQYEPADLINPVSSITGTVPEMRPVENWYFDLPAFRSYLEESAEAMEGDSEVRAIVPQTVKEFLVPPIIFVKNEAYEDYLALADQLPPHQFRPAEKGKQSFELEFDTIIDRDAARPVLAEAGIRLRTGKALVPFRITGNIEWGVRAPEIDGVEGLTVWCWPESLWAPISFTIAANDALGLPRGAWRDFWCAEDACVYQFIGQDNLYFYGVAQPAMWEALKPCDILTEQPTEAPLRQTTLVANHHMLFGKTKASSSGKVKPPTGEQLLEHYTVEQLRAHFLALGLDQKSVGFSPKPFDPDEAKRNDPRVADPVLKEGALLTNVFNRLARSCFYEAQRSFDGCMPLGPVTPAVVEAVARVLQAYETTMHRVELHSIMSLMDGFIRYANKYWTDGITAAQKLEDAALASTSDAADGPAVGDEGVAVDGGSQSTTSALGASGSVDEKMLAQAHAARRQVLVDSFFLLRVCTLLMHPVVPKGCEAICDYLSFDFGDFFSWNYDFESMDELCSAMEIDEGVHRIQPLPPRFDFFRKHDSQYK